VSGTRVYLTKVSVSVSRTWRQGLGLDLKTLLLRSGSWSRDLGAKVLVSVSGISTKVLTTTLVLTETNSAPAAVVVRRFVSMSVVSWTYGAVERHNWCRVQYKRLRCSGEVTLFFFDIACNSTHLNWSVVEQLFNSMSSDEFHRMLPLELSEDVDCVPGTRASSSVRCNFIISATRSSTIEEAGTHKSAKTHAGTVFATRDLDV